MMKIRYLRVHSDHLNGPWQVAMAHPLILHCGNFRLRYSQPWIVLSPIIISAILHSFSTTSCWLSTCLVLTYDWQLRNLVSSIPEILLKDLGFMFN